LGKRPIDSPIGKEKRSAPSQTLVRKLERGGGERGEPESQRAIVTNWPRQAIGRETGTSSTKLENTKKS